MNRDDVSTFRRRALLVGVLLFVVAAAYILTFAVTEVVIVFGQEKFSSAPGGADPLTLYLDVTAIDPVRHSMALRLDVAHGASTRGLQYFGKLDRDVELEVSDGESVQTFRLRPSVPLSSLLFDAGLQGELGKYPFDSFSTNVTLNATELSANNTRRGIPLRVTVWEGVPAWYLSIENIRPAATTPELTLAFGVQRPRASVYFSCVIYGLMVLIALCSLVIGSLTFVGKRRIEVTLIGALAAMVFALPILRNVLPGAPPLGVIADVLVFLWAEIAVTIGLALFVTAWAWRGTRP
jgi:hypothetical protein